MTEHRPYDRQPTPDERMGMTWWNALPKDKRRRWLTGDSAQTPAEAWAMFKRGERHEFDRKIVDYTHRASTIEGQAERVTASSANAGRTDGADLP